MHLNYTIRDSRGTMVCDAVFVYWCDNMMLLYVQRQDVGMCFGSELIVQETLRDVE